MNYPANIDHDKYTEVLKYLLRPVSGGGANNSRLGKVKLMKLLYFVDFEHYYRHGKTITGDTFYKRDFGPVPAYADMLLNEMKGLEQVRIKYEPVINFYRYSYELTDQFPEFEHLDAEELMTLADVVSKWQNHTTADIVTASHGDPPWALVGYNDVVPFHLVYYRDNSEPSDDEEPNALTESQQAS